MSVEQLAQKRMELQHLEEEVAELQRMVTEIEELKKTLEGLQKGLEIARTKKDHELIGHYIQQIVDAEQRLSTRLDKL